MMHTTARADHKELSAKKALCRSRLERWHGNYHMGIVLFLWLTALLQWSFTLKDAQKDQYNIKEGG